MESWNTHILLLLTETVRPKKKKKSCSYPNIFGYILITDFFRKEKRKKESAKFFLWLVLEKRS